MEQRLKESLSALLDGEADELELHRILALSDEAELRALWARYHRVRMVMGTDDPRLHHFDISASVAAAIAQGEAAEAVPVVIPRQASESTAAVAPVRPSALLQSRWWKLGGVAASVAVAFVVGLSVQKSGTDVLTPTANPICSASASVCFVAVPLVEAGRRCGQCGGGVCGWFERSKVWHRCSHPYGQSGRQCLSRS